MGDTTLKESLASSSSDSSLYKDPETGAVLRLHYANRYLIELVEKRVRRTPTRYAFTNLCVSNNLPGAEEIDFSKAVSGPETEQWKLAMSEELQSFEYNDAW